MELEISYNNNVDDVEQGGATQEGDQTYIENGKTPGFYICPRSDADGLGFTNYFMFCDRCMSTYGKVTRTCLISDFGDVGGKKQIAGWSVLRDVPVTVHKREKKKMCKWLRRLFKEVVAGQWDIVFEGVVPDMSELAVQQQIVEYLIEGVASEEASIFTPREYHDVVSVYMATGDVNILDQLTTTVYQGDADFCPECSPHILEEFPQYCATEQHI